MRFVLSFLLVLLPLPVVAQGTTEPAAVAQFQAEKNPEAKKKLALNFEKNYPRSRRLPDVYIELSKALVSGNDYVGAKQYAEKAVTSVEKLKAQPTPPENTDKTWHDWLSSMYTSGKRLDFG